MKVNFNIAVSALVFLALVLGACSPSAPAAPSQPALKVLAVETFLAEIAQNVAGERVKVESLIPIGLDPHAFQPTPQDVKRIAESNVLIISGAGLEEWLEKTLENAGGTRQVIEASAGLTMRQPAEAEMAHEPEHGADVHSVESHAALLCTQLQGKSPAEEIQAGSEAASAAPLKEEHAHDHAREHEREVLTLKLNPSGGAYSGYVLFEVEADDHYAITSGPGQITVTNAQGETLDVKQTIPLECGGMKQGQTYDLAPGAYIIALSDFSADSTPFSIAPIHGEEGHADEGEHAHQDEHGHHHHEGDPHFWLDPNNIIKYVENIRDGLIAADPAGKDVYTQNTAAYIAQLKELDSWIQTQVAQIPAERRLLVTNHESFGYFADRYGFKVIGTVIPSVSTGASPTAQELAALSDHIRETGVPAIFLETGASPQLAQQLAAETGIKVVTELFTHSITEPGGKAPTYISMMKHNVNAIIEALK